MSSASQSSLVAWGQILRISLLPTAMADILAGFSLASLVLGEAQVHIALFASSAFIYHGSMALNDWADLNEDRELRPGRPLPMGLVRPEEALAVATTLIIAGICIAAYLSSPLGVWMAGIAALAAGYNIWLRGRLTGPICLASCRGMHLAAPIIYLAPEELSRFGPVLVGYAIYVLSLSILARDEALPEEKLQRGPKLLLLLSAAAFATPLLVSAARLEESRLIGVSAMAIFGAGVLVKTALSPKRWTPEHVQSAVGTSLRLLLVYTAAVALSGQPPFAFLATVIILTGYPVAHAMRKVFPPS